MQLFDLETDLRNQCFPAEEINTISQLAQKYNQETKWSLHPLNRKKYKLLSGTVKDNLTQMPLYMVNKDFWKKVIIKFADTVEFKSIPQSTYYLDQVSFSQSNPVHFHIHAISHPCENQTVVAERTFFAEALYQNQTFVLQKIEKIISIS